MYSLFIYICVCVLGWVRGEHSNPPSIQRAQCVFLQVKYRTDKLKIVLSLMFFNVYLTSKFLLFNHECPIHNTLLFYLLYIHEICRDESISTNSLRPIYSDLYFL